jgi:hypothetical protein
VGATVVIASFLQKLIEPPVFRPTQVLDQPAHGCRQRDELAAGIGIGQAGKPCAPRCLDSRRGMTPAWCARSLLLARGDRDAAFLP